MRKILCGLFVSMLIFSAVIIFSSKPSSAYTTHTSIRINSNANFHLFNFNGDGSVNDPWIIENYEINGTGLGFGIYIGNTTDYFIIRNCYIHHCNGGLNWSMSGSSHTGGYKNNWFEWRETYSPNAGVFLYNVTHANIKNNTIEHNEYTGILMHDSSLNVIQDNEIKYNADSGIYVTESDNITIDENRLYQNRLGLYTTALSYSEIINNNFNVNEKGTQLMWSKHNRFKYNLIVANTDVGMHIVAEFYSVIENNTISWNKIRNLDLLLSEENIFSNNTIANSIYGIELEEGWRNRIYRNNFINNTLHVGTIGESTYWCLYGQNPVGNYWDNYNGTDIYSDFNQDVNGSDGFGDTPYGFYDYVGNYIELDDRFPLMNISLADVPEITSEVYVPSPDEHVSPRAIIVETLIISNVGEVVMLDASSSYDNVGIVNYTWTFYANGKLNVLYGPIQEFTFLKSGNYSIKLEVYDAAGNVAGDSLKVDVIGDQTSNLILIVGIVVLLLSVIICIIIILKWKSKPPETKYQ